MYDKYFGYQSHLRSWSEADVDPLERWGKENNVQDSTIQALKEAGFELDDLPNVTESDINELNDEEGIPTGHKRRLLTLISQMSNSTSTSASGSSSFVFVQNFVIVFVIIKF